jgi:hypothetical protein
VESLSTSIRYSGSQSHTRDLVPPKPLAHHCPHKVVLGLVVVSTTGERLRRPMTTSKPQQSCHKIPTKKKRKTKLKKRFFIFFMKIYRSQ